MFVHCSCYTLEEVAKRWNCDIKTLLLLACDGAVAIALPPEIDGKFYYVPNTRDFLRAKPEERVEIALICTTPEAARGIIRDNSGNIITDADLEVMTYKEKKEILGKVGRANTLRLEDNQFTVTELVITQAELKRFERENQDKLGLKQDYQNITSIITELVYRKIAELKPQVRDSEIDSFFRDVYQKCAETTNSTPTAQQMLLFVHNNRALFNQVKDTSSKSIVLISGTSINQGAVEDWKKRAVKKPQ